MKIFLRILLILAILLSFSYFIPAYDVFTSITSYPKEWQGGIDSNSTIVWFLVITIGYGYLMFQSVLAIFGLIFGFKSRKAAYWFLLLPGFIGIVFSIIWWALFVLFDAEWPASWSVVTVVSIPVLVSFITGKIIRKRILPKPFK